MSKHIDVDDILSILEGNRIDMPRKKRETVAKQQLYDLMLEIIELDPANRFNCEALRIEQRQKLTDLFNTMDKNL